MVAKTEAEVQTSGGTVALTSGTANISLTVPASFYAASASFQIKQVEEAATLDVTSHPSSRPLLVGSHVYRMEALANPTTAISTFDNPLTVTITYASAEISGFDTSSLEIHRWDGGSWNQLSSCSRDGSARSVSCSTSQFSIFGLFGSESSGGGGGGKGGGGGGYYPTPTPTPTPSISPTPSPSPTSTPSPTPAAWGIGNRPTPSQFNLKEGATVAAYGSNDPDVYIINDFGFKRLFLNPVIFGFYGHLRGFKYVSRVTSTVRDAFETSGLFRNCETNSTKVYAVEVTGEDTGILHWVNTTGAQAVADDSEFFKKVFCINTKEFNWYTKNGTVFGAPYTLVLPVPRYSRK